MAYTIADNIQDEIRATSPFTDLTLPSLTTITAWIEQESAEIDNMAGMSYASTANTVDLDYNGDDRILLKKSPIIAISAFKYAPYAIGTSSYPGWLSKVEDTDFTVYKDSGEVEILLSNFSPEIGSKRFRIEYTSGYTTTPQLVQKLCTKMVAMRVLNSLLQNNVNEGNDGGSISVGSISIVEPASYGVNSYKALQAEIDGLKQKLLVGTGVYRFNC